MYSVVSSQLVIAYESFTNREYPVSWFLTLSLFKFADQFLSRCIF